MQKLLVENNIKNYAHFKECDCFMAKKDAPSSTLVADLVNLTNILKKYNLDYKVDASFTISLTNGSKEIKI